MLNEVAVKQFKVIYEKKYCERITEEEAREMANQLIDFLFVLLPRSNNLYVNENENKTPQTTKIGR